MVNVFFGKLYGYFEGVVFVFGMLYDVIVGLCVFKIIDVISI